MTETNHELIPNIIAAAIAAAGPMGSNTGAWKARVNEALPHIVSMMGEGSRQTRIAEEVLTAHVFTGTYVSHSLEESSTRMLVMIDSGKPSKRYPDGIEPIRSHRTDNAQGRAMAAVLDKLEPGQELVIWRAMESMGDGVDANTVRTLVHLETRPKRKDSPAGSPPSRPVEERVESRSEPHPSATPRSTESLTDSTNSKRLQMWRTGARESLTNDEFVKLRGLLELTGYDFDGVSEVEWDEQVRPLIRQLINERNQ